MFLTREEILNLTGRPFDGSERDRRAPHINLQSNLIIDINQENNPEVRETWIYPQHFITIITESISIDEKSIGFLYPKIFLQRNGLFIINTGIVHPSYNGPLSIQLVNFGKSKYFIKVDEPILELLIYRNENQPFSIYPWNNNYYVRDRRNEAYKMPKTFLDVLENEKKLKGLANEGLKNLIVWAISILGLIATVSIIWQAILTNNSIRDSNLLIEKFEKSEKVVDRLDLLEKKLDKLDKIR